MFLVHFVSFISLHTLGSDPFLLTAPILQNVKWLPCAFFIVFISLFASVPLSSLYTLPWASSLGHLYPHSRVLCHMLTPFPPPPGSTRKRSQLFLCMRSSIGSRHRSLPFIVYLDAIISFNSISCFLLPSSLSPLPLSIIIWEKKRRSHCSFFIFCLWENSCGFFNQFVWLITGSCPSGRTASLFSPLPHLHSLSLSRSHFR